MVMTQGGQMTRSAQLEETGFAAGAPARPRPGFGPLALTRDFTGVGGIKGVTAMGYVLAASVLEAVSFSLLIPLLGAIFAPSAGARVMGMPWLGRFFQQPALTRLSLLLGLFTLIVSLRAVVVALRDVSVVALQARFTGALRLRLAQRLAATRWDYVARLRHARVSQLMGADIQRLAIGVELMLRGTAAAGMLLAQGVLLLLLSPALALAMLLLLCLGLFALNGTMARTRAMGAFAMEANLALLDGTAQFLGGLKLAMSQGLETGFVGQTGETIHALAVRQGGVMRQQAWNKVRLNILAALAGCGLLLAGYGWLHVPPAILVGLAVVGARMAGPAGQVRDGMQQLANVLPVYESLRELESELAGASAQKFHTLSNYPHGPVEFHKVAYRHADTQKRGLKDFSLILLPGEMLGVTGPSGSGKTTFADLLAGLYAPDAGQILAGGNRLEGATLAAWRRGLSYVSQDAFLFHDTIRRNLAWANPRADEAAMWQALEASGANGLVWQMEKGLDTVVGERGILMSGGERQRIALSRALLRQPQLLLLDEATSALDGAAERQVLRRLAALEPRPTLVVIAHRLENMDLCDRVIAFETDSARERRP